MPEPLVDPLRGGVALLHVEADPLEAGRLVHLPLHPFVEGAVDPAAALLGDDVDRLDPEDDAVAPVAPFEGGEQAADRPAAALGDPVGPLGGIGEDGRDAAAQGRGVEPQLLGLAGHAELEVDDRRRVPGLAGTDRKALLSQAATSARRASTSGGSGSSGELPERRAPRR